MTRKITFEGEKPKRCSADVELTGMLKKTILKKWGERPFCGDEMKSVEELADIAISETLEAVKKKIIDGYNSSGVRNVADALNVIENMKKLEALKNERGRVNFSKKVKNIDVDRDDTGDYDQYF